MLWQKGNGLTEEPPVVSLRGDGSTESLQPIVSEDMKDRIVKKMFTYPTVDATLNCFGTGYGKPVNSPPPMPDSIDEDLSRFVGPGSMKFFENTHLNSSFLHEPVANWELNPHYHEARRMVVNLAVTNDAAGTWYTTITFKNITKRFKITKGCPQGGFFPLSYGTL